MMINTNPIPPVSSSTSNLPAQPTPVIWLPVDSGHLTPLIVPIFINMPSSAEGMINVEGARPIEAEDGISGNEKGGDKKVATDKPLPPAEANDSKEVSKEKIDLLARFIAKEIIPEKLANLTVVRHTHQPMPTQPSKDDKTAVAQAEKDPENSNLAVPKESVKPSADQPSYNKSSLPSSTTTSLIEKNSLNDDMSVIENALGYSTPSAEISPDNRGENLPPKIEEKTSADSKRDENSNVESNKEEGSHAEILERGIETKQEPNKAKEDEFPNKEKKDHPQNPASIIYSKNQALPIYDLNKLPNDQAHKENRAVESITPVEASKRVQPRKDTIPPTLDKNESLSIQQMHKFVDESLVARMPIMPDFPLSREGILRHGGTPKNARLREDQGYRLGDLMVMILSAVLGGATNTSEICRYLLSKEKFFKVWMGIKNAIPTYRMLWFLLNRLEPTSLEFFLQQALSIHPSKLMNNIHVWESHRGFTLGELIPLAPSQESDLLIDVLDLIDSRGAIVNVETLVLNKKAARKIKLNGGEYILTLKDTVYEKAEEFLQKAEFCDDQYRDVVQDGTATFIREITSTSDLTWFEGHSEWPHLQSLVKLMSESIQDQRISLETKLYLSSLPMQADKMAQVLRIFSVIESKVNWLADFDFLMQSSKVFHENESINLQILARFSSQLLTNDTNNLTSIEAKRKKVREDNEYLRHLINNLSNVA